MIFRAFTNTVFPDTITKAIMELQVAEKAELSHDGLSCEPRISWSSRAASQASVLRCFTFTQRTFTIEGDYNCGGQCDQIKIAKCLKKLPKNGFTRKMNDFDTFTKIA